jgi:alcohol dehydrogenase class IV
MVQSILVPSVMVIGGGSVREAAVQARALGIKNPLIVSDRVLQQLGTLVPLQEAMHTGGFDDTPVFTDTVPEPTSDAVDRLVVAILEGDHDGLIAIGGGSPIDTAKAAAVLATHGGAMRTYKVPRLVTEKSMPVIAIPTTAGTGSEVTRFTVITDSATDEKMLCAGSAFLPRVALVDFELTLTMPKRITADTGLDALTHAIEAYVSRKAGPFTDALALAAMQAIHAHIRAVYAEPGNQVAREAMMLAATQAGMAFSNASVALVHGMSRPIGAMFHVPHGLSNAMLLPTVTAYSAPAAFTRYADCARAMGVASRATGDIAAAELLVTALGELNVDLEVPSLRSYVTDEKTFMSAIPTMVQQALASGSPGNNPRVPLPDVFAELYRQAWHGTQPGFKNFPA